MEATSPPPAVDLPATLILDALSSPSTLDYPMALAHWLASVSMEARYANIPPFLWQEEVVVITSTHHDEDFSTTCRQPSCHTKS
jgi:hypothetical protein